MDVPIPRSNGVGRVLLAALLIILVLALGVGIGFAYLGGAIMANDILTDNLSVPLNGTTSAKVDVNSGTGNLTIDGHAGDGQLLASGTLQYLEKQGPPSRSVSSDGRATTLLISGKGGATGRPRFRLPWSFPSGACEWQIHLNSRVHSEITAHSGGGNIKLNLAGMTVARLAVDAGGGNMDLVLPDNSANLIVDARTGGGNVTITMGGGMTGNNVVNAGSGAGNLVVRVPNGIAARVHATTGFGKVIMDPRFIATGNGTYQSSGYDATSNKIEITLQSGAGNVSVTTE